MDFASAATGFASAATGFAPDAAWRPGQAGRRRLSDTANLRDVVMLAIAFADPHAVGTAKQNL
jgi:hypothetical protein